MWHAGTFAIINGFFRILDLKIGTPGIQWAFWITAFWSFAPAFHVLAHMVDGLGAHRWPLAVEVGDGRGG